jgi:hypothetical protein
VSVPPRRYDSVDGLLTAYRLSPSDEEPFPNDGWSGASLTRFTAGTRRYVLKRDGWDRDWIARATNDVDLREARIVGRERVRAGAQRQPSGGVERRHGEQHVVERRRLHPSLPPEEDVGEVRHEDGRAARAVRRDAEVRELDAVDRRG